MNTPFIDFKATEITPEKQICYFVEPDHLEKLVSQKASLIFGERGSGKTTILRHLEKRFNTSDRFEYIGVYYRFETAYVKALNNPELTVEQNISAFSQSMAAIIGKLLCNVLEEIKSNKNIVYEREIEICKKVVSDIEIKIEEDVTSFRQLSNVLERVRKKTLINLQNGKVVCFFDYTTFIPELCEELRKELIFKDTCFCILLDEYENLTYSEQRVVNSFIKASSYFLTYKVCMRPEGFLTKDTVAEKEQLMDGHDYEEFDYVRDIVGKESNVKKHLRKICTHRLEYFYEQQKVAYNADDLEIDNYLEIVKDETDIESWERIDEYRDELKEGLKKKYPNQKEYIDKIENIVDLKLIFILSEKKTKNIFENISDGTEQYRNWVHNYKKNIIYQIISECEQTKKYCGFDTFIKLANGNTRTMLEILHYAFGDYNKSGKRYGSVSIKKQTEAVYRVAGSSFEQIDYIPVNGYKAKNLANALGNLFETCLIDSRARKFEVNSFSIKATKQLDEEKTKELKSVLHDAVVWGVLIPSKANKLKSKGAIVFDGRDYVLHPILSPYFKISYRKRQKYELKDVDVYSMLFPKPRNEINSLSIKLKDGCYQQELEWD